jgi:hypothetical protein
MSVAIKPGETALTRIPSRPTSIARPRVIVSRERSHVDDRAARTAARPGQPAHRLACAEERARHVDGQRRLERPGREIFDASRAARDPGVIDEGCERSELRLGALEEPDDIGLDRDVCPQRHRPAAAGNDRAGDVLGALAVSSVVHGDRVPPGRGKPSNRSADAATGPRDDKGTHGLPDIEQAAWFLRPSHSSPWLMPRGPRFE